MSNLPPRDPSRPPQVPPRPPLPVADTPTPAHASPGAVVVRVVLAGYTVALALIAFWPTPVDAGLARLLAALTRRLPVLTYERIEFLANIAMFVPLGVLLAIVLVRSRALVLPIVFVTTFLIECVQALLLPERTPSVMDIVANTAGGCMGLLAVAAAETLGRLGRRR